MKRRKQSLICMRDLRSVDTSRVYFSPSHSLRYLPHLLEVNRLRASSTSQKRTDVVLKRGFHFAL